MNPAAVLLDRLHAAGATLHADGDQLRLRSATPLSADLLAEARANKPALLHLVLGRTLTDDESDAADIANEPPLPAPGTPQRQTIDQQQARMLRGLLAASHHRPN